MLRSTTRLLTFALCIACLAAPLSAKEKKDRAARKPRKAGIHAFRIPKNVVLTAEQQTKFDEIRKELEPKIEDAKAKEAAVLTEEQKTLKLQAEAEAKEKIIQIKAEVATKAKITPEQAQQLKDTHTQVTTLDKEARAKVLALLTEEQKTAMHTKAPKGEGKAKRVKKTS